jgi:hypothetical protein
MEEASADEESTFSDIDFISHVLTDPLGDSDCSTRAQHNPTFSVARLYILSPWQLSAQLF